MHQLPTAGEAIIRKHRMPFGGGTIPLAFEIMEADLLLDNWQTARAPNGNAIRMGVEIDEWHRPVAYWFSPKHPGDYQFTTFEPSRFIRVPAEDIIHLYIIDRWPQTRGEPWFHSALKTLHNVGGYEDAEIVKARASANIVGFIRSPEPLGADGTANGRSVLDTEPGTWQTLLPGEDVAGFAPNTPNPAVDPFLRYMLRKMAVGIGVSYESLSRDYSQSNYSSSRMALLDDRDLYRMVQGFLIRNFRADIHREFMDAAVLVGEIKVGNDYFTNPDKYQAVRYKPRGWSWIDPAKEVAAYKMAVRSGFMTVGDVIAQTSPDSDIEDTYKRREEEIDMAEELGLVFDTNPAQVNEKGLEQPGPALDGGGDAAPGSASGATDGDATGDDTIN
jgi:lambda family phage portal protein